MNRASLVARQLELERALAIERARTSMLPFVLHTKKDYEIALIHRNICLLIDGLYKNSTARQILNSLGLKGEALERSLKRKHEVTGLYAGLTNPDMIDEPVHNAQVWCSPRVGKSEILSRRAPAYWLGRRPNAQIIATSFAADLAQQNNRDVQRIIDGDEYKQLFPGTTLFGSNVRTVAQGSYLRNSDLFEVVGHKGFYKAAGVGGAIMGRGVNGKVDPVQNGGPEGAGIALVDDPYRSRAQAESPRERYTIESWFFSTLLSRLETGAKLALVNTRWHGADVSQASIAKAQADPQSMQWLVLAYPAILDCEPGPGDFRRQGEALWPGRYPISKLNQIRASMGSYDFEALHQQRPVARAGGILKTFWFKFYDVLPPDVGNLTISVDLAYEDQNDFCSFQVWGSAGARRYLIDHVHGKMTFTEQLRAFTSLCRKHPTATTKLVEKAANGAALINTLATHVQGIIPIRQTTSKEARVHAASPQIEAGNVYLPTPAKAPWVDYFVTELTAFPSHPHDDACDAATQYLIWAEQRAIDFGNWSVESMEKPSAASLAF